MPCRLRRLILQPVANSEAAKSHSVQSELPDAAEQAVASAKVKPSRAGLVG
jgi:hypothetical protein